MADVLNSARELSRENDIRIAAYLLTKLESQYDEELFVVAEKYVRRHKELQHVLKSIAAIRASDSEADIERKSLRERIRFTLEHPMSSLLGKIIFLVTTLFVVLSVICVILRSMPAYSPVVFPKYKDTWLWIEGGVTIYFTLELIVRVAVAEDAITWFKKPMHLADILSNVPFFIELITEEDLGVLSVLRLLRVSQFFRKFDSINDLFSAVWQSLKVLTAPLIFLGTCLLIMSTVVYYAERGTYNSETMQFMIRDCTCESSPSYLFGSRRCDSLESKFLSIPHAMWWGVVTLTTVGYGELVPLCPFGKIVAAISMVMGVMFMAMPIAIVGSYFTISVEKRKHQETVARLEEARLIKRRKRRNEEAAVAELEQLTPAIKFIRFLKERIEEGVVHLDDPGPYVMMLVDFYFGTKMFHVDSAPAAVSYELAWVPLTPQHSLSAEVRRYTLNRYVDIVIGSRCDGVPDPDIVVPIERLQRATGVTYRISQRHAVISVPPQFSDVPMTIKPLRGVSIYVNGQLVPQLGVVIATGDVINLHTLDHPLLFQVKAVHPDRKSVV